MPHAACRMPRASCVALVLGLVLVGCGSDPSRPSGDGPIAQDPTAGGFGAGRGSGRAFTFGGIVLYTNPDARREEIVIDAVRLENTVGDIELIGARVGPAERGGPAFFVTDDRWPIPPNEGLYRAYGRTPEARGYRFKPSALTNVDSDRGAGVELLLGLRAREEGRLRVGGFRVDYRQGDRRYSEIIRIPFKLCAT